MAIHIEHVGVKNLGPLTNFDKDFKNINLIYARNEHGKTFLVEFIYRSLFKVLSIGTREISSPGQVTVTGLKDRPVVFSPSTRLKLEDFWADSLPGLPRDFSKLLVVKGAELDLSLSNPSGVDDAILKEFLSGEGLLDKIGKNLGKTESIAVISDGKITGAIRGDVKRYYDLGGQITKIDSLFQEINQKISGGKRYQLALEIEALTAVINEQEKAKRNLAFLLYQQTNKLKDLRKEIPDSTLAEADRLIRQFRQNQKDIEKKGLDLSVNKLKTRDYPWLDTALIEYQNLVLQESAKKPQSGKVWLIATILSAIFAILLIVFNQPYIGIAAIVFAFVFGFIYLKGQTGNTSTEALKIEIEKIAKEYKDRFGASLSSGTTMRTKLNELKPIYYSSGQLQKDIDTLNLEQKELEQDITRLFGNLVNPVPEMDCWEKTLAQLIEKNRDLDDWVRKNDIDFAALDIQPDNFIEGQASEEFNHDKLVNSKLLLETTRESLQKAENEFQQLKQAVCGMTSADINTPWDELIEKVQAKRGDTVNQYRDVAANIMAQVKLNEVLNDLRAVESERIDQGLSSDEVQQAVKTTTGHYSLVEKDGSEIYVSDQYGRYKLKDLSTGAREQVLLGLRIGFAARILAGQPLFLILDDAFQHSDWERRERLVNELYTLAGMGWQIIYFTMDDHIRNLFEDRAKGLAEGNYQTILLESD
jgi:uncharacterized protein YhaN